MNRNASASWRGGIRDGKGTLTSPSGVLNATPYSFATRFGDSKGTNPEELIAAAHAGCYSMALSMILGEAGVTPEQIDTSATVALEKSGGGFAITTVHLDVRVRARGMDEAAFESAAKKAKDGCPVSKVLNAKISMDASLES